MTSWQLERYGQLQIPTTRYRPANPSVLQPAGVGIGKIPPIYLGPGDRISISVTGLGTLSNRIASKSSRDETLSQFSSSTSHVRIDNSTKSIHGTSGLTTINGKALYCTLKGSASSPPILFIHGLGGSSESFAPLISTLQLENSNSLHLLDLEGHGQSPTNAMSTLSIRSFAVDASAVIDRHHPSLDNDGGWTIIAHSMGCYVALRLAAATPSRISKIILLGPPPMPLPAAAAQANHARAALVREKGMQGIVDAVSTAGTSQRTKDSNQLGLAAVRLSLLSQEPEGYAKGCTALATATEAVDVEGITARVCIVTGAEDRVSTPEACERLQGCLKNAADVVVLEGVGHWHLYEDPGATAAAVRMALK